jgi:hypothetical protein
MKPVIEATSLVDVRKLIQEPAKPICQSMFPLRSSE